MKLENLVTQAIAATAPFNFTGTWRNELNSTMELSQTASSLTGTYKSYVNKGKKPSAEGPVIGFANGNLIAFSVNYVNFSSISSWVGTHYGGKIETLWYLDQTVAHGSEWDSINAGADVFHKVGN